MKIILIQIASANDLQMGVVGVSSQPHNGAEVGMSGFRVVLGLCLVASVATASNAALFHPAVTPQNPIVLAADTAASTNSDDTDFLFRLGMVEGHLIVGHELLVAHQNALALPHFGHPVRELYDDLSPYLKKHKFPDFDRQLTALEAAATGAPDSPKTEAQYQEIIETVHKARTLAPAKLRASLPEMIKICSDTIDAASGEYGEALEKGQIASIVEYHDSRGYLAFVAQEVGQLKQQLSDAKSQDVLDRFKAVLAKAQWIVADLVPNSQPRATVAEYRAIVAEAATVANSDAPAKAAQ